MLWLVRIALRTHTHTAQSQSAVISQNYLLVKTAVTFNKFMPKGSVFEASALYSIDIVDMEANTTIPQSHLPKTRNTLTHQLPICMHESLGGGKRIKNRILLGAGRREAISVSYREIWIWWIRERFVFTHRTTNENRHTASTVLFLFWKLQSCWHLMCDDRNGELHTHTHRGCRAQCKISTLCWRWKWNAICENVEMKYWIFNELMCHLMFCPQCSEAH